MMKHVNFEDDLFALTLMVRGLADIVKLDADPAFFRDKLASDVFAVDAIMARIGEALGGCSSFMRRGEHLKELLKLKKTFLEFLDEILSGRSPLAQALSDYGEKLAGIRDSLVLDIASIRDTLARSASVPAEREHMVSEEEFKSLLGTETRG